MNKQRHYLFNIVVIVAALGYFVDIYDLLLFGIVRVPSLTSLGLSSAQIKDQGAFIISIQMTGLLIGGIIAGIIADRKGRLSVLFGSIILYSLANFANGFVHSVNQYAGIRFIAGLGLAGELGVGITLVSEILPKEKRGIGTSFVAGVGISGAVLAYFISKSFHWRTCYFIGGVLGFFLLILRVSVFESEMFKKLKHIEVKRGDFLMLFTNRQRLRKYLCSILVGLPTWYIIGILITFSKEFGEAFHIKEKIDPAKAIMVAYASISIGDFLIGFISQWFRSRKAALFLFYGMSIVVLFFFFNQENGTASQMYLLCGALGFSTGYWAIFVTMAAEQFGTNIRATVATTAPNMVRGSLPLLTILFYWLQRVFAGNPNPYITAGWITGVVVMILTLIAAYFTEETFHKDLNYVEK
jgi:MFS transporter, putative metabolite:H+ symporter